MARKSFDELLKSNNVESSRIKTPTTDGRKSFDELLKDNNIESKRYRPSVKSSGSGASSAVNKTAQNTQKTTSSRAGIKSESNTGNVRTSQTVQKEIDTIQNNARTTRTGNPNARNLDRLDKLANPVKTPQKTPAQTVAELEKEKKALEEQEKIQAKKASVNTAEADKKAKTFIDENKKTNPNAYLGTASNGSEGKSEFLLMNEKKKQTGFDMKEEERKRAERERLERLSEEERKNTILSDINADSRENTPAKAVIENNQRKSDEEKQEEIRNAEKYTSTYNNMSADAKAVISYIVDYEDTFERDMIMMSPYGNTSYYNPNTVIEKMETAKKARMLLMNEYGYTKEEIDAAVILHGRARNAETAAKQDKEMRAFENEHPVLSSAASVPMNIVNGVVSPVGILDSRRDVENAKALGMGDIGLDPNNQYNTFGNASQSIRDEFTKTHDLMVGDWDAGDFLYNTAMSGLDSAAAGVLPGWSGALILGANAATSKANELSQRGISTDKAIFGGIMAGAAETVFEKISIGNLKSFKEVSPKTVGDIVKNIAKSMGVNASEEAATEIANIAYDTLANGGLSQYEMTVRYYINEKGMTPEKAKKKAALELAGQIGEAAASGALMGLGFGGAGNAMGAANTASAYSQLGAAMQGQQRAGIIAEGKATPEGSRANKQALKVSENIAKKGVTSNYSLGKLAAENAEYTDKSGRFSEIKSAKQLDEVYNNTIRHLNDTMGNTAEARSRKAVIQKEYENAKTALTMKAAKESAAKDFAHREQRQIDELKRVEVKNPELIIGDRSVNVAEIVDIEDGDIKVKTTGGDELSLSQSKARFADADVKRLYDEAAKMNKDTAKVFLESYDGDDVAEYKRAFEYYYNMGKAGTAVSTIRANDGVFGAILTADAQQRIAEAGLMDKEFKSGVTDWSVKKKSNLYKFEKGVLQAIGEKFGTEFIILDESSEINAKYLTGTNRIVVYRNADGGVMLRSAAHETYHFVENYSAKDAADLRDYVVDALKGKGIDIDEALEKYVKQGYATRDEQISELVADSMFDVFSNEDFIKNLTAKNQTLAKRLANHIGELVQKIREAVKMLSVRYSNPEIKALMDDAEKLDTIRNMLLEGYKRAGENFKAEKAKGQKNNAEGTAVKYSIHSDSQGDYVKVDVDQNIFDNKNVREMQSIARKIINQKYKGKVLNVGVKGKAFVNKRSADEYAYPANRRMDDVIKEAKMRSSTELDNLLAISKFINNEPDDGRHPDATGGWDIYETRFEVANIMFAGEIKIKVTDRGFVFYDITQIRRLPVNGNQTKINSAVASGNLPNNSIPKTIKSVKQNLSESDAEYLEAVENGDTETAQRIVDEAAKVAGYEYKLYHQTGNDFTVFDTKHKGAGTGDSETPFGIFMKPTSANIGLKGQKQMPVYAAIKNPLVVGDRDNLMHELKKDATVNAVQEEIKRVNADYKQRVDQAGKDLQNYLIEYRKKHPDEPRSDIYKDKGFNEIYDREDSLIDEWTATIDKLSIDSKNAITEYLKSKGYDGVIIEKDAGSFGRETKTYIALDNTQVKSADSVTYDDNGDIIPLSERFKESNVDIRYSMKQTDEITKFNMKTAKENRIYRQIFNLLDDAVYTGIRIKKIPDPKFIRQQAQEMLKEVGSTYSVDEFAEELTVIYEYMSQQAGKNLYKTEDFFPNVLAIARRVVDQCTEKDSSAYDDAKEIRDVIKETPIYISPELKNEIISQFGSYKAFRQLMMGRALRLTTTDTSATPLDVFWKEELTTRNQTYFPEDTADKDMPAKILEFFDKIKPTIVNTKSDVEAEASIFASEIIKRFSNNPDRMMTKKGEIYKEYMKNHLAQVKTAQKELRETLQNEAKAEYETRLVAYKTKREYTDRNRVLRNKAERDIWYMQKRIEKETDNDNIPQKFKPFVKSLLRILPTEGGAVTYNADKISKTKEILQAMKNLEETGSDFVLGDSIYDEIAVCIDNFFSKIESTNKLDKVGGNKRTAISISNLTNEELELLNKITTTSRKAIQDYQKLFKNGRNMSVEKYSLSMHRDLEAKAKPPKKLPKSKIGIEARKRTNKIKGEATKYITPAFLFERLGEKGKELFKNLRNGENVVGQMIVKGQKAFNNAWEKCNFDERWRYKHEDVKLSSGTYNISVMDLISFYCTVRQKQGLDHVLEGGMMITQVDRDIQQHIHFTEKDVEAMVNKLTPDQKLYGELMVEYMSGDVAADRNVVSMRKYGIEKYNTHNYYPLKVSSNYNKAYIGRPDGGQVISGQSSAKRRIEGAVAPLVLENFETVVTRHLYQSALYCGYVLPLDDIKAVLNYRSVDRSVPFSEEQSLIESAWLDKETSKTISIKEDIKNAVGEEMYNRLIKFLEDVDSGSMKVDESKAFTEFIVKAKKAAVMANLSVVVQQPFAFIRGTKGISPKNIVLHTSKVEIEEMKKWNGCAVIKEIGYFDAGIGRTATEWMLEHKTKRADRKDWSFSEKLDIAWDKKDAKIDERGGKLASKADELTWGCLWATVKKQVKNENPDLEGDALLEKAAERFQDMIAKTQVYDSVFAKSEAQRTNTTYMKLLTAFKGEPITSFNGIVGAIYDLTEAPAEEKKAKLKDVSVTVGLYVLSTIFTGAAKSLVYALRDDDDDKSFIEKFTANLVYNTVTDPIGMIPLADKVIDALSGYTSTSMDTSFITYLGASFDKGIDMISVLDNDKSTEAEKKKAIKNFVTPVLKAMSLSSGVPADRVISDAISITNQIWDKITKKTSEPTTAEGIKQAIAEKFNASATDYEQIYEATIKGDTDHYDKVYKNLVDAGKDERNIDNGLATALSENDERIKLAYQAMESGDSATSKKYIEELTAIGFKDDVVASAINKYETRLVKELSNKDERVVKAAEAFDSGDYSTYISIKDELIDEGEYSESVIDSAIDKHLKDGESQAYENFLKDLVKKDSRIASAYNKLSSGESADKEMESLEKDGYEEEIVYTALQRYQNELIDEAEKDPRIYEAAQARYDMKYDEYERIVNELIAEKKYPEGVIESAVDKQLEAVVEDETKAFEAADKDRYSKYYDLKNAIVNGNKYDVADVYNRYVDEHGVEEAGKDVRSAIKQAYKKEYIEYDEAESLYMTYAEEDDDKNDVYWALYEAKSETNSKYDQLDKMVENGDEINLDYLLDKGVEGKDIKSRTTRKYKKQLLMTQQGTKEYKELYNTLVDIYEAAGDSTAQAKARIREWYKK